MAKSGFTLFEAMIAMVVVGTLVTILLSIAKPNDVKQEALQKAGLALYRHIDFATNQIIIKNSPLHSLDSVKLPNGTSFSIENEEDEKYFLELYKKYLVVKRIDKSVLEGEITLRNNATFEIKLNGDCTQEAIGLYNPMLPNTSRAPKSCGLIYFDVNGNKAPNILGVDKYIVSIGKLGLR